MNWTKLSAVAETLSSVAVLVMLIYLTIELKQNTLVLESNTRQTTLDNAFDLLDQVIENPDIWLSFVKENLTEAERVRLSAYLFSVTERGQAGWLQYQAGALDEASWLRVQVPVVSNLQFTQGNKWWEYFQSGFEPGFRDHVNSLLEGRPILTQLGEATAFD